MIRLGRSPADRAEAGEREAARHASWDCRAIFTRGVEIRLNDSRWPCRKGFGQRRRHVEEEEEELSQALKSRVAEGSRSRTDQGVSDTPYWV